MEVRLTYFRPTGKYYSDGSYETGLEDLGDIWDEVRHKNRVGDLPGLVRGSRDWVISIDVPEHPHNHPRLVMGREP